MTIHKSMFDKKGHPYKDTLHRIYVEFKGGYFVTSLDPTFNSAMQEMVADYGSPIKVEFRASDKGWYDESNDTEDSEVEDLD